MVRNVADSLAKIKSDLPVLFNQEVIEKIAIEAGHRWRRGVLDPATTICLFVRQVLAGNVACEQVVQWMNGAFTAQAYCEARKRLPLELFVGLLKHVIAVLRGTNREAGRWRGLRTYLVDSTLR